MKSIYLNTLLELIVFSIMLINILFLLNLANINKLLAYFNNIINELI